MLKIPTSSLQKFTKEDIATFFLGHNQCWDDPIYNTLEVILSSPRMIMVIKVTYENLKWLWNFYRLLNAEVESVHLGSHRSCSLKICVQY